MIFYDYDMLSRLLERRYVEQASTWENPESVDSFTYDLASRLLSATKGRYNNTITYNYDQAGRRLSETQAHASGGHSP